MKRIAIPIVLLISLLFANGTAFGFPWLYHDFGASVFGEDENNKSPISYPGIGFLPSPGQYGESGEKFDEEGLFLAYQDGKICGALANPFGAAAYSTSREVRIPTGDLFFGFHGAYDQFALDLETGELCKVGAWEHILDIPGSYYSNTLIRHQVGAFRMTQGRYIGTLSQFMMREFTGLETNPLYPSTNGDTYVYEWCIDMSMLEPHMDAPMTEMKFHHTLACGNDMIEREYAIPEPGTSILPGAGVLGVGIVRRRMKF